MQALPCLDLSSSPFANNFLAESRTISIFTTKKDPEGRFGFEGTFQALDLNGLFCPNSRQTFCLHPLLAKTRFGPWNFLANLVGASLIN